MKIASIFLFLGIIAFVHAKLIVQMGEEFEMDTDGNGRMIIKMKKKPTSKPTPAPKKNGKVIRPMYTAINMINPFVPHIQGILGHVIKTLCGLHSELGPTITYPGLDQLCDESFLDPDNLKSHIDPYLGYLHSVPKTVMEPIYKHQNFAGDFFLLNHFTDAVQV